MWRSSFLTIIAPVALAFFHYREECSHFFLWEIGFAEDKNDLVLSWVSSEASKEKDTTSLGVIIEDFSQSKFTHVELVRLD